MSNNAMTAFAQAALAVSDLVAAKFASRRFGGSVPRTVKVQAPMVPSTGGGKQARESIVLFPEDGDGQQAITVGFIDVGLRALEVRTYAAIAGPYQQRFGRPLDLPKSEYDGFTAELQGFLSNEGYVVKVVDVTEQAQKVEKAQRAANNAKQQQESGGVPLGVVFGLMAVVSIGALLAIVLLR
ncbi:MAG TPA: hypothetical protein VGF99_20310 [Myxococcota bacterium]